MLNTNPENLPKMLYAGDISVDETVGGSVFLYRLLRKYPAEKLLIIESNLCNSSEENRLKNTNYQCFYTGNPRFLHSRIAPFYSAFLIQTAQLRKKRLQACIGNFRPSVILTVAHGTTWLAASYFAKVHRLPLHLIVHDDWLVSRSSHVLPRLRPWADKIFESIYRQAQFRWCISGDMEEYYFRKYGVHGSVLPPIRSEKLSRISNPVILPKSQCLKFAYAGSLHVPSYRKALVELASVLAPLNCSLNIFTSLQTENLEKLGLLHPIIKFHPFIEPEAFIDTMRQHADVLFLPLAFKNKENDYETRLSFPSKLADYTAAGLPILIWGDSKSSGVRWASKNVDVAYVVDTPSTSALEMAVKKLIYNPELREKLANRAIEIGFKDFSNDAVTAPFYLSL